MKCKKCGSSEIDQNIEIGIGPKKYDNSRVGMEPMYCDLCLNCGEIVRIYIDAKKTRQKWLTK